MKKSEIEERKQIAELKKKVEQDSKPSHCLLCGRKITSCCNSHVVPQFILKQIAEKGHVYYGHALYDTKNNYVQSLTGINNAFTFKLICHNCDSSIFRNYENPDKLKNFGLCDIELRKNILTEMAIKAHLSHIQMKLNMHNLNCNVFPQEVDLLFRANNLKTAYEIDIKEHLDYINYLKTFHKKKNFPFYILFDKLFEYKMNVATQTIIAYLYDMEGCQRFNPYDLISRDVAKYFYLMILPYENKTRVIFYIEKRNKDLEQTVIDSFLEMDEKEKLHFIFISLIIHDEQFYMSPSLCRKIMNDKKLRKLYSKTDLVFNHNALREIVNFRKYKNYLEREQQK